MTEYNKSDLKTPIDVVKQLAQQELLGVKDSLKIPTVYYDAITQEYSLPRNVIKEAIGNSRLILSFTSRSPSLMEYIHRTEAVEFESKKGILKRLKEHFSPPGRQRFAISIHEIDEFVGKKPVLVYMTGCSGKRVLDSEIQSMWNEGYGIKEIVYLASLTKDKIITKLLSAVS